MNKFDLECFDTYKENNCLEVKKAKSRLPQSLWETYSAFANTYGGMIILGVEELNNRRWKTSGLKTKDKEKLLDEFWNQAHNTQKINLNLLTEKDIETYEIKDDLIIVIHVPMAKREQKPIFINNDLFRGTFERTNSGGYH